MEVQGPCPAAVPAMFCCCAQRSPDAEAILESPQAIHASGLSSTARQQEHKEPSLVITSELVVEEATPSGPKLGQDGSPRSASPPSGRLADPMAAPEPYPATVARPVSPKRQQVEAIAEEQSPVAESASAPAPAPAPASAHPDFSGIWVLRYVEGDMEKFLTDTGVSWSMRKAGKAMGYGVGKLLHEVVQEGEDITIRVTTPKGRATQKFTVGIKAENVKTPDGDSMTVRSEWIADGKELLCKNTTANGVPKVSTRRFLRGSEMVIELIAPAGTTAFQCFAKQ